MSVSPPDALVVCYGMFFMRSLGYYLFFRATCHEPCPWRVWTASYDCKKRVDRKECYIIRSGQEQFPFRVRSSHPWDSPAAGPHTQILYLFFVCYPSWCSVATTSLVPRDERLFSLTFWRRIFFSNFSSPCI